MEKSAGVDGEDIFWGREGDIDKIGVMTLSKRAN
jgi:hypothetical protein